MDMTSNIKDCVLISIKPKFADEIIKGNKLYEYRKKVFRDGINKVYIYSSSPIKMIIGEFEVDDIVSGNIDYVWDNTTPYGMIDKEFYNEYFKGHSKAYAIKVKNVIKYDIPINPKEIFNNFTAPQSYMYINKIK